MLQSRQLTDWYLKWIEPGEKTSLNQVGWVQLVFSLQGIFAQFTEEMESLAAKCGGYSLLLGWVSLEIDQQLLRDEDL